MPYSIEKDSSGFEIYKLDASGKPAGNPVAKFDNEADAKKKLAELEAAMAKESANPRSRTGYFGELMDLAESVLDVPNRKVRVTLIKPGWSANNRYYSKRVLGEAVPKFEGRKAYFDHPSKDEIKQRPERSVRDVAGWYDDVKQETDGRLTASLNVLTDDTMALIETTVTKNPSLIELSINALGDTVMGEAEGRKGIIVEAIKKANSTDIVTSGAAGGSLLASNSDEFTTDLFKAMSVEELKETLREVRPDLVEAWQKEWKTPRDTAALETAHAETDTLKETVDKLTKEIQVERELRETAEAEKAKSARVAVADRLLKEAKLPADWVETIREDVQNSPDETAMKAIIEREETKAASLSTKLSPKGAGAAVSQPVTETTTKPTVHMTTMLGGTFSEAERKARTPKQFMEAKKQRLAAEAQLRENH